MSNFAAATRNPASMDRPVAEAPQGAFLLRMAVIPTVDLFTDKPD
jgi:hypothetical protein